VCANVEKNSSDQVICLWNPSSRNQYVTNVENKADQFYSLPMIQVNTRQNNERHQNSMDTTIYDHHVQ
jgi:hypothetical protein